jgi:2-hydroxy-3-keto-5-methylthiopentenyl-1-phosphate phosphatase
MTRRDFYQLVAERLLPPGTPDYWGEYRAGRLTHFEALNAYFAAAVPGEAALREIVRDMGLDPDLRDDVRRLRATGWAVVVASAGCRWYISRLLREAGAALEVHANPGAVVDGRLVMELPRTSPVFSPSTGIDKPGVVRHALATSDVVAFAGDGPPDLEPALLVRPELRFATGHLAGELERLGERFRRFEGWSDVAGALAGGEVA